MAMDALARSLLTNAAPLTAAAVMAARPAAEAAMVLGCRAMMARVSTLIPAASITSPSTVCREDGWLAGQGPADRHCEPAAVIGGWYLGVEVDAHAEPVLDQEHHADRGAVRAQRGAAAALPGGLCVPCCRVNGHCFAVGHVGVTS